MDKIRKFFRRLRKIQRRCSARVQPMDCTEQESQGEGPLEYEVKQAEDSADGVAVATSAPLHLSNIDGVSVAPSAPLHLSDIDGAAVETSAPLRLSDIDGVAVETSAPLSLTKTFESHSSSANDAKQGFKRQLEPSCVENLSGNIPELPKGNKTLPQQQKKSNRRARRQKRQLEQWEEMLEEKTLLLEAREKAFFQARRQAEKHHASYLAKGEPRKETAEWEVLQEQVAQLQRENLSLRQQLEDAQNTNQRTVRQLQQELAEAVGKQHVAEASLKTSADLRDSLKKENSKLQEDLDKANAKVRDLSARLELEHSKLLVQRRANEELRVKEAVLTQRLEAVLEDYKISAWIEKRREEKMQEKLADSCKKQSVSETSLKRSENHCHNLENDILILKESLDKANVKVYELSVQLEMERQNSLQLEMTNRALQDLVHQHRPQAIAAGCSSLSQTGRWHEERAPEEMGQNQEPSLFFPAASQSRLEEINAKEAMFRKQQRQRIAALTSEMERAQSMHQESLRQIAHWQAELDLSEKLFLVGEDIRRSLANK